MPMSLWLAWAAQRYKTKRVKSWELFKGPLTIPLTSFILWVYIRAEKQMKRR
jgi:hypothetical protein